MPTDLTGRQRALLAALERLSAANGYPPSIRELGAEVGLSSTSSVHRHVRVLRARGLVISTPATHRSLRRTVGD